MNSFGVLLFIVCHLTEIQDRLSIAGHEGGDDSDDLVGEKRPNQVGGIRLVDGSVANEGRVEVFRSGQWQTVCDDGWDLNDADVACRQLGYGYAIGAVINALFGQGTGGQWEAYFSCTGSESGLENCTTSLRSCSHMEDAGVICSNSSLVRGSLRLVGSREELYGGRLEVYINRSWGTVCDDIWSETNAKVACEQMGFVGVKKHIDDSYDGGPQLQMIWLDEVSCTPSDSKLIQCSSNAFGVNDCNHYEDVGIVCSRKEISPTPLQISNIVVIGILAGCIGVCCIVFSLCLLCVHKTNGPFNPRSNGSVIRSTVLAPQTQDSIDEQQLQNNETQSLDNLHPAQPMKMQETFIQPTLLLSQSSPFERRLMKSHSSPDLTTLVTSHSLGAQFVRFIPQTSHPWCDPCSGCVQCTPGPQSVLPTALVPQPKEEENGDIPPPPHP